MHGEPPFASLLLQAPALSLPPESPSAFSLRARCIRMRWMHRTPRVMHDALPIYPYPRQVGGVPRGSFAFSDTPPSAARPPRVFFLLFAPPAASYFSSYYTSVSSSHSLSTASLCGFSAPLPGPQYLSSQPSVNRLHRFPLAAACSRARCASVAG